MATVLPCNSYNGFRTLNGSNNGHSPLIPIVTRQHFSLSFNLQLSRVRTKQTAPTELWHFNIFQNVRFWSIDRIVDSADSTVASDNHRNINNKPFTVFGIDRIWTKRKNEGKEREKMQWKIYCFLLNDCKQSTDECIVLNSRQRCNKFFHNFAYLLTNDVLRFLGVFFFTSLHSFIRPVLAIRL